MSMVSSFGFGERESAPDVKIKRENQSTFKPNDFDRTVTQEANGLVKFEAINRKFSMKKLLQAYGLNTDHQNMYCPFHDDYSTGKPSAKYHPDTDKMYCFSESKMYTAYHALKILFNKDMDDVFKKVWAMMSYAERGELLDKYSDDPDLIKANQSVWDAHKPLLEYFKNQRIDYKQFKTGLYKVFMMQLKENENDKQGENKNGEHEY